jgi:hypothetical protein
MKKLLIFPLLLCIEKINSQNITAFAGNGTPSFCGDGGQALSACIYGPSGLTFDANKNMYIADQNNNCIRKINTLGIITTVAGNTTAGYSGDGGLATSAQFNLPNDIIFDPNGNMLIADWFNNSIRKINSSGIISTVVGNGTPGYSGDGGPAINAKLNAPCGIAFDRVGNLYIADEGNNCIRKVDTLGFINTVAGNGTAGYFGDGGQAINSELDEPAAITIDLAGNIYFIDLNNNCIRKINTSGIITTIAGNGTPGYSGDGGIATSAQLNTPGKIILDAIGNLYITDQGNERVRKVNTSGIITTIAGTGSTGNTGDGGLALSAQFHFPAGLTFDPAGNLYIGDFDNNRVRMINSVAGINESTTNSSQAHIYPNPTGDQFFIEANTTDKLSVDLYDVNSRHVFNASVMDKSSINVAALSNGAYTLTIKTADHIINKKLVILR